MLPPKHVQIVIIHLVYVPSRKKSVMMTRERSRPSGPIAPARTWYSETYFTERAMLPLEIRVRYKEWTILSGDDYLLTVDGHRYDHCYIFLGVENSYWYFFENEPGTRKVEGSGVLHCSHCGCCIHAQYRTIIDTIKTFMQSSK